MDVDTVENDPSDCEEIVEEEFIHVVMDDPEEMSILNSNSNVRMIALESDSPAMQIENKIFRFNEWRHISGTAMFFQQKKEAKTIDPLYDNRCGIDLEYIGSTTKCLEMSKKDTIGNI